MILIGWLTRVLGGRMAAAAASLTAVLALLDLFETTPRILDAGRGAGGVGAYLLLRSPQLLQQAIPLGVLAGALFGFNRLARDGGTTALRATGMSIPRLVLLCAPAAAAAAGVLLVLAAWGAPRSEQALAAWWRPTAGTPAPSSPKTFRLGPDIVTASRGDAWGRRLIHVTVHQRDADGRLLGRLTAAEATDGSDGRWRLRDAAWERYDREPITTGRAAQLSWSDRLDPRDVRSLFDGDAAAGPAAARRALRGGVAPAPPSTYRTELARVWAGPAGALVMLLIAAPAAFGRTRDGGATRLMLAGLAAGLLFLVTDGVMTALGAGGVAPAAFAAWAAPVLFASGAVAVLMTMEG